MEDWVISKASRWLIWQLDRCQRRGRYSCNEHRTAARVAGDEAAAERGTDMWQLPSSVNIHLTSSGTLTYISIACVDTYSTSDPNADSAHPAGYIKPGHRLPGFVIRRLAANDWNNPARWQTRWVIHDSLPDLSGHTRSQDQSHDLVSSVCTAGCVVQLGVLYSWVCCTAGCVVQLGMLYSWVCCTAGYVVQLGMLASNTEPSFSWMVTGQSHSHTSWWCHPRFHRYQGCSTGCMRSAHMPTSMLSSTWWRLHSFSHTCAAFSTCINATGGNMASVQ